MPTTGLGEQEVPTPARTQDITIAVLTDIHTGSTGPRAERRSEIADILLLRAVQRLNRLIHPDVTVVLGDLADDGRAARTPERLAALRQILDKLASPSIVLPGNHDGDVDAFYRIFERPADSVDIGGVRFLPFIDPEEPACNARRRPADLERFRQARASTTGPIVALQHVCLAPPEQAEAPYNYTNAPDIIRAMAEAGVVLSLSGHYHAGAEPTRNATTTFVTAPALCEAPFRFLTVTLARDGVRVEEHQLAMPAELGLVDMHVHTQLAYCSANMDVETTLSLAQDFGLAGVGFSEHSGQLAFTRDHYWGGQASQVGIVGADPRNDRMPAYLELKQRYRRPGASFGLEVDCDYRGDPLLKPADRRHIDHVVGAIHRVPSMETPSPSLETMSREFMVLLERFLEHDLDILAHPFRIFRGAGHEPPEALFRPVAALLREHGTAAEINYHINTPPPAFIRTCLEMGTKISFGSDAHSLYEIGEFADHLKLLADLGFNGDLGDVLVP